MAPDLPAQQARRQRLIDAAVSCVERSGLAKTTLEDVAAEAEVSRQTVYRYFANRDELLLEALLCELDRHAGPDPTEEMVRSVRTPGEAVATLVEGVVYLLESVQANLVLASLLATEGPSVRATLDGASRQLFGYYEHELGPWIERGQQAGFLNPDLDPAELCEWVLRITLSLLTTEGPVERDTDELRRYLTTYLTPVLAGPA